MYRRRLRNATTQLAADNPNQDRCRLLKFDRLLAGYIHRLLGKAPDLAVLRATKPPFSTHC